MLIVRATIFDKPDKAPSRELESDWCNGRFWLRLCQHCNDYASKGRDANEPCEFCGRGAIVWVSRGIDEFTLEEEE